MKLTSLFVFAFLLSVSFVSAQYYGGYGPSYGGGFFGITQQAIDSFVQNISPILQVLLGGQDWTGYLLFEKTLLFILISIIVGLVLTKVPVFESVKNKGLLRFIAVIIALLGVRNLNYIWVGTILVQYQVLFITVAGILPFLIYWFFVQGLDSSVKKIAWIFYAVIYFGLWSTNDLDAYESVYLWSALTALIYGLVIDKSVQRYLEEQKIKHAHSNSIWLLVSDNKEKVRHLERQLQETDKGNKEYPALKERINSLYERIKDLTKQARE